MVGGLIAFSGVGEGFLMMLPTPGRSERPERDGVLIVLRCGELVLKLRVGMLDVGFAVMTTSSAVSLPVLVMGLWSV